MNGFDLSISSFINGFAHRSLRVDEFVVFLSNSNLLKGGVVIGLVWWLWFQNGDVRRKREVLLAAMIASFPALAVARILSWIFFRPRPLNETRFLFRVPYGAAAAGWEGLSSFPSDHAVLFFALAIGIFFVSRRAGWFTFAYVSIIICLPRIFLGVHYTTDILAGAAIGGSMVWLANLSAVRKPLTSWALQWQEARPEQFYCFSFILTYQMAEQFDSMLKILKVAKFIIQGKFHS
jgi:membrane-associated phospholipid phosphatase